jgi:hypothetical protein
MGFQRINQPMYHVSCDRCEDACETVDGEEDAFLQGYHKVTMSIEPNRRTEPAETTIFASVIVWFCEDCFFEFIHDIKPYVPYLDDTDVDKKDPSE